MRSTFVPPPPRQGSVMGLTVAAILAVCSRAGTRACRLRHTDPLFCSRTSPTSSRVYASSIPSSDLPLADPLAREVVVVAEVLEPLKGSYAEETRGVRAARPRIPLNTRRARRLRYFSSASSAAASLGEVPAASRIQWVSEQETGSKYALDARVRGDFVAAVRAYRATRSARSGSSAGSHPSNHVGAPRLPPADALILRAPRPSDGRGCFPSQHPRILPILEPLLTSSATPIGVRMGLLVELERRGLVEGPPRWAMLLRTTKGEDRLAAVRASAAHPSEAVAAELRALLANDDSLLVAAAAVSLGTHGN